MRASFSTLCSVLVAAWSVAAAAQESAFNIGRAPTAQELRFADAAIRPDGQGLPPGSGTAEQGAIVYGLRGCAGCHGPTGAEGPAPVLVASRDPGQSRGAVHHEGVGGFAGRGIRSWPFAPLIWSFINRSMPLNQQGYLTASEVYSVVAFLLERNEIIQKGEVMDAKSLAQVKMPGHENYVTPPWDEWTPGRRQREIGK